MKKYIPILSALIILILVVIMTGSMSDTLPEQYRLSTPALIVCSRIMEAWILYMIFVLFKNQTK